MTIVSRPWQRLSPAGRILLPLAVVAGGLGVVVLGGVDK